MLHFKLYRLASIVVPALLVLMTDECSAQQKVQFTQYMFNGLVINPAYAGADEALSVTFINRNQWVGVENAPVTQTLSAHTLFEKKKSGVGLSIVNDKIGVHKNLSALGNYAFHLQTGEKAFLSMGLQAGIRSNKSDYESLLGPANTDPKLYNAPISKVFFNFGAGIYYRSPKFHLGLSAPEFLPERFVLNDSIEVKLNKTNLFLFFKYRVTLMENLEGEPGFLIKYLPGVPVSFDLNWNVIYRKVLTAGISYRKKESVDFLLKAQLTPQLQFGYAYDHPIGDISALSNGSHEIVVHYLFRYFQTKVSSPR
jgi:type IX secretion system PorP/SprF family membrane protein